MQFRVIESKAEKSGRAGSPVLIQFIRSSYDKDQTPKPRTVKAIGPGGVEIEVQVPGVRRSTQKLIGSIGYHDRNPSDEQVKDLTAEERSELLVFLSDLTAKERAAAYKSRVQFARFSFNDLADAISSGEPVSLEQAILIWESISKVTKALKKAGHPKPVRTAKEAAEDEREANPAQGELLPHEPPKE